MERLKNQVMRYMRNIIFDKRVKKYWSNCYPIVESIINAQFHSVTKVSPAQIIYCNTIDLGRAILRQGDEANSSRPIEKMQLSEWPARMLQAHSDLIRIAQGHQK